MVEAFNILSVLASIEIIYRSIIYFYKTLIPSALLYQYGQYTYTEPWRHLITKLWSHQPYSTNTVNTHTLKHGDIWLQSSDSFSIIVQITVNTNTVRHGDIWFICHTKTEQNVLTCTINQRFNFCNFCENKKKECLQWFWPIQIDQRFMLPKI